MFGTSRDRGGFFYDWGVSSGPISTDHIFPPKASPPERRQGIRRKEYSGKKANKHKVKESAESQRIHGNISLSTKNDPCIENGKEGSTIQKELSCKTNNTTKRDSALHFSHERVNRIKNSVKSDKCILKFSRDGMQLSDVKKPSNSNSDLLLHSRTEQNLSNDS